MNIVMINGSMKKESSYNIGKILVDKIKKSEDVVKEYFLPNDLPEFCDGCNNCLTKMEDTCPHYKYTKVLAKAMDEANLLIFTSPVYANHASGQMKVFLDHYSYRWMIHRPRKRMFNKQAVIITTNSLMSTKRGKNDIKDSLFNWGIGRIYSYEKTVHESQWRDVSIREKELISLDLQFIINKIYKRKQRSMPCLKTKLLFYYMRMLHNKGNILKIDKDYWDRQGWLGFERPWKDEV